MMAKVWNPVKHAEKMRAEDAENLAAAGVNAGLVSLVVMGLRWAWPDFPLTMEQVVAAIIVVMPVVQWVSKRFIKSRVQKKKHNAPTQNPVKWLPVVACGALLPFAGCATTMSELSTVQTFEDGTSENTTLKTQSRTVAWAKQDEGSGEARYTYEGGELVTGQAAKGQASDVPLADALAGLAPLLQIMRAPSGPSTMETLLNSDVLEAIVEGALDRRFGPMVEP